MRVVADDPEQRHAGCPGPAVALADQLPVDAESQPGDVGVRDERRHTGSGVVADLEQGVDAVRREVEDVPRLEPGALRELGGEHVHGIAAAMVVEHDNLLGACREQPACGGGRVGGHAAATGHPVGAGEREDLVRMHEARDRLHVDTDRDPHDAEYYERIACSEPLVVPRTYPGWGWTHNRAPVMLRARCCDARSAAASPCPDKAGSATSLKTPRTVRTPSSARIAHRVHNGSSTPGHAHIATSDSTSHRSRELADVEPHETSLDTLALVAGRGAAWLAR